MFLDSKISVSWTICMREFLVLEGKFTLSMNEKRWNHVCVQQWEVDDMESLELNILDHLVLQVSIIVIHSLESTTLSSALLHIGNKPFPEARAHYCHKQARDQGTEKRFTKTGLNRAVWFKAKTGGLNSEILKTGWFGSRSTKTAVNRLTVLF